MARKLTDEEREKINELTSVLCKALPAAQRNFGAGIASALVRIPRPQITMRDLGRICGKYGEDKPMLIDLVKAEVLDAVEGQEGPAAWTLRSFGEAAVSEEGAAGEKDKEPVAAAAAEAPAEKPAEKPRPGRGSRRRAAEAAAAEVAAKAAEEVAVEVAAAESPVATDKPKSRRRRRAAETKEAAESGAEVTASEPAASADVPEPVESAEPPTEKPRTRRRRRSAAKTEAVESSALAEPATPAEPAPAEPEPEPTASASTPEDVQAAQPVESPAPVSSEGSATPNPEPSAPTPSTPEPAQASPARRGRLRRRSSRPGRREEAKQPQGLAEVPYVRRGGETETQIREKIVALDQRFWMNGWLLSHPGAYTLYEHEITSLNDALKDGTLHGDITRRQLAYQMGGDEKFFEFGSDGLKLLRAMGVEDLIRHRPMPKPDLLYHAPRRRKHMRVLVTENLDPWLDVRDLMYEDGRSLILGERIHAVVLGGGTPVLEHNRLALLLDTLGADDLEVLYWGDIDRAGLEIYAKLRDMLTPTYDIKPFTVAYQLMADRAAERFPDPLENETTGQVNIELADPALICEGLTSEAAAYSTAVLENCRLVPQEILTKRDL